MRRATLVGTCALLGLGLSQYAEAEVVRISFDTAPDGSEVVSGTAVDTLYSSWGVTFRALRCSLCGTDPSVYAVSNCRDYLPISRPNIVSLWPNDNCTELTERLGLVQATFATPADSICLLVMPVLLGEKAVVRAYNSAGMELVEAYSTPSATGTFCIEAQGISRVTFSGAYLGHAWFDDLVVRKGGVTPTLRRSWGSLKAIYR